VAAPLLTNRVFYASSPVPKQDFSADDTRAHSRRCGVQRPGPRSPPEDGISRVRLRAIPASPWPALESDGWHLDTQGNRINARRSHPITNGVFSFKPDQSHNTCSVVSHNGRELAAQPGIRPLPQWTSSAYDRPFSSPTAPFYSPRSAIQYKKDGPARRSDKEDYKVLAGANLRFPRRPATKEIARQKTSLKKRVRSFR